VNHYRKNVDMPDEIRQQFEPPFLIKVHQVMMARRRAIAAIQKDMLRRLQVLPLKLHNVDRALIRRLISHEVVLDVGIADGVVDVFIHYKLIPGTREQDVDYQTRLAFEHMAEAIEKELSASVGGAATLQEQGITTSDEDDKVYFTIQLAAPRPDVD